MEKGFWEVVILFAITSLVIGFVIGNLFTDYKQAPWSDGEMFEMMKAEAIFLSKILPDKTFADLPVHMDNNKSWIMMYLNSRKGRICNGSRII